MHFTAFESNIRHRSEYFRVSLIPTSVVEIEPWELRGLSQRYPLR